MLVCQKMSVIPKQVIIFDTGVFESSTSSKIK